MIALYHKGLILSDLDKRGEAHAVFSEALELSRKARIYDISVATRTVSFIGPFIGDYQIKKRMDGLIRVAQ